MSADRNNHGHGVCPGLDMGMCGGKTHPHQPAHSPEPAMAGEGGAGTERTAPDGTGTGTTATQTFPSLFQDSLVSSKHQVDIFFHRAQFVTVENRGAPG